MTENIQLPEGMNPEVLEHLMDPKNYGKLESPSGVGVALDEKSGEYVIFYIKTDGTTIQDVRFATNGCQDTVVVGSMFTQMIKERDIEYSKQSIAKLNEKLSGASAQQQICADMVLSAFSASLQNYKNLQNAQLEELHVVKMKESCDNE